MQFRVGQVLVFEVDPFSRDSLATGFLLRNPWTHVSLVVTSGDEKTAEVLNTYPATNAQIIPIGELVDRRWRLFDPELTEREGLRLLSAAESLVGRGYWLSPCSRVVAEAFRRANIDFLKGGPMGWREETLWLLPSEYLSRLTFPEVARKVTLMT